MADRFYCPELPHDGRIVLDVDESRHLARVSRRVVGDEVEIFDGRGLCLLALVEAIGKDRVELTVAGRIERISSRRRLTLLVAPPKGDRFDWLVEKATELGVSRLIPILAERSVVDPRSAKLDRLRRLVIEASKQSGRATLMDLSDPIPLARALVESPDPARFLADSGGLERAAWPGIGEQGPIAVAIGPEGGWTDSERRSAAGSGWVRVGLGITRLRVETAALAAAALLLTDHAGG